MFVAKDADTLLRHGLVQHAPQIHVEALQDFLAAIDQRRLDAEAVKDVGELDRDVAAAGNHNCLGQFWKIESLVGEDAVLVSRQGGMRIGPATSGNEDLVGGDSAVLRLDAHGVGVDQHGARMERLAAGLFDAMLVEAFEPRDFVLLVGDQGAPVETCLGHSPAIAGCVGEMFGKLRGVNVELFRHAAADDAGAAVAELLGDGDALAEPRRHARGANAARAAADDKKIVVVTGHGAALTVVLRCHR